MAVGPRFDKDRYFLAQHAERREELRAKLNAAADELAQRADIAETLKVQDAELIERIVALGFNGDSARVLDLLPLIYVSWADGRVQHDERATILAVLEERGIEPESDACLLVESLLEHRPSETFLGESLSVLRALTASETEKPETLVDLCFRVAEASGGLLGLGNRTSPAERDLIAQIAEALGVKKGLWIPDP